MRSGARGGHTQPTAGWRTQDAGRRTHLHPDDVIVPGAHVAALPGAGCDADAEQTSTSISTSHEFLSVKANIMNLLPQHLGRMQAREPTLAG